MIDTVPGSVRTLSAVSVPPVVGGLPQRELAIGDVGMERTSVLSPWNRVLRMRSPEGGLVPIIVVFVAHTVPGSVRTLSDVSVPPTVGGLPQRELIIGDIGMKRTSVLSLWTRVLCVRAKPGTRPGSNYCFVCCP